MKPQLIVRVTVLAIAAFVGYHLIYLPQQRELASIRAQVAQEQVDQQTQADVAQLLTQLERDRKRLPDEPNPSWLMQAVTSLGQQAGIQLTTISPEPSQAAKPLTRLAVTLQFTATYHELGTFLDLLQRSDHFIRTEHITVNRPDNRQQGKASMQVVLSTSYVPPLLNEI